MRTINGIIADKEVALWTGIDAFLTRAAFHTQAVITAVHVTSGDERHLYVTRIDSVAVLCPPRAINRHILNNQVLDTRRHEVQFRTVTNRHTFNHYILRIDDIDQRRTHLLLCLRRSGDIRNTKFRIQVEREPDTIGLIVLLERSA